jgi:hypothetical protein
MTIQEDLTADLDQSMKKFRQEKPETLSDRWSRIERASELFRERLAQERTQLEAALREIERLEKRCR